MSDFSKFSSARLVAYKNEEIGSVTVELVYGKDASMHMFEEDHSVLRLSKKVPVSYDEETGNSRLEIADLLREFLELCK